MLEINAAPDRRDLNEVHARAAAEAGVHDPGRLRRALGAQPRAHEVRGLDRAAGLAGASAGGQHSAVGGVRRVAQARAIGPETAGIECDEGGPPSGGTLQRVHPGSDREGGPLICCMLDWISAAGGWITACSMRAGSASRSVWRRPTRMAWMASRVVSIGALGRSGCGGDGVDDGRAVRPRHIGALWLGGRARRRGQGQGLGAVGVQDRSDRCVGAGRALAPRSGAGDLAARFAVRQERERARWRLHLVKHRSALKHRVHSALMSFGHACPVSDLFGVRAVSCSPGWTSPDPWRATCWPRGADR